MYQWIYLLTHVSPKIFQKAWATAHRRYQKCEVHSLFSRLWAQNTFESTYGTKTRRWNFSNCKNYIENTLKIKQLYNAFNNQNSHFLFHSNLFCNHLEHSHAKAKIWMPDMLKSVHQLDNSQCTRENPCKSDNVTIKQFSLKIKKTEYLKYFIS